MVEEDRYKVNVIVRKIDKKWSRGGRKSENTNATLKYKSTGPLFLPFPSYFFLHIAVDFYRVIFFYVYFASYPLTPFFIFAPPV